MTKSERLNMLYQKYGLTPEDMFRSPQGWVIFTRQAIDKIQADAGIDIEYDVIVCEKDFVVVKARGSMLSDRELKVETFGEADRRPGREGNCKQNYPVAMAEKRAMSRAVLKLSGFYSLGVYSEDEGDFEKAESKPLTSTLISKGKDAILRGEKTAEEVINGFEGAGYEVGESIKYSFKSLKAK